MSVEFSTTPRGILPSDRVVGVGLADFLRILQLDANDVARVAALTGGLMVGDPSSSSVTRSRRFVAASATNPSSPERLKATANGLVLNSLMPTGSKLTPMFMLSVGNAPGLCSMSIVDRQLWTLTLNRNGPFGDEHVPGT